jgi:hypothetical protein
MPTSLTAVDVSFNPSRSCCAGLTMQTKDRVALRRQVAWRLFFARPVFREISLGGNLPAGD